MESAAPRSRVAVPRIRGLRLRARRGLLLKYALIFASVVGGALLLSGLVQGYFAYQESKESIGKVQREQAARAASEISRFVVDIEADVKAVLPPGTAVGVTGRSGKKTLEERALDLDGLLLRNRAIRSVSYMDSAGIERIRGEFLNFGSSFARVLKNDGIEAPPADYNGKPEFDQTRGGRSYIGPAYFPGNIQTGSGPALNLFMTVAVGQEKGDEGAIVVTVNLALLSDVVKEIRVGKSGRAFVVDPKGILIAHPDVLRVLQRTDLSGLAQVQRARANPHPTGAGTKAIEAKGTDGSDVLTSYQTIESTGWNVFVEQPSSEALSPLNAVILRTTVLVAAGLLLAVFASLLLARRMVTPIRALTAGAARIAEGDLETEIEVRSGDELEALAGQFNRMAARLGESYATLEHRVEARTAELAETNQRLEVASQHKSEFLAHMSHELRTPLNAIIGYAELLQDECADTGQEDFLPDLQKIHSAGKHLLTLISGILDLSKIEAGRMTVFLEDFEISTLASEVEAIVKPLVEKNGNALIVDCPTDIGAMHADIVKLRQTLFNLISNSAKFTQRGSVTMAVRRWPSVLGADSNGHTPAADGHITFSIIDTGIGISEEAMARLFEAFSQAEASTTRNYGGTGLGLALSRQFCRMMGGDITVESVPGEGSTFTITLPATVVEPETAASVP